MKRVLNTIALGGFAVTGLSGAYIATHEARTPEEIILSTPEGEGIDSSELIAGSVALAGLAISTFAIEEARYQSREYKN